MKKSTSSEKVWGDEAALFVSVRFEASAAARKLLPDMGPEAEIYVNFIDGFNERDREARFDLSIPIPAQGNGTLTPCAVMPLRGLTYIELFSNGFDAMRFARFGGDLRSLAHKARRQKYFFLSVFQRAVWESIQPNLRLRCLVKAGIPWFRLFNGKRHLITVSTSPEKFKRSIR